jgi:hypothetical protein
MSIACYHVLSSYDQTITYKDAQVALSGSKHLMQTNLTRDRRDKGTSEQPIGSVPAGLGRNGTDSEGE